jgi:hypothetical protein
MKINLKAKIIVSMFIITSIIILNPIKANATIYTSNVNVFYADSYQWEYRDGGWICATPSFHQTYSNAWVCTNGKWYYINKYGYMVTNTWVDNYYVDDTGAWIKTR